MEFDNFIELFPKREALDRRVERLSDLREVSPRLGDDARVQSRRVLRGNK